MSTQDLFRSEFEVLNQLDEVVKDLMEKHLKKQNLWFSSDFLPANEENTHTDEELFLKLRKRAKTLPDSVRVCLYLNLLTEEGLPHFHRIISTVAKFNSSLGKWNNLWTAEEDRHGNVIRDYAREARLFDFRKLELHQFDYILAGFQPSWVGKSPFSLFVYTTLQEKATQLSHSRTSREAGKYEPSLKQILDKISEDEARHYAFYLNLVKAILECDPSNMLIAMSEILPHIDMPGIAAESFKLSQEVQARLGVYTLRDYKEVVERVIGLWKIEGITGLNEAAVQAQEKILLIPNRLDSVINRIEGSFSKKTFQFDVLYGREFTLG